MAVLVYSMLMSLWLAPSLGRLRARDDLRLCDHRDGGVGDPGAVFKALGLYGVILFLISDSILAVDKFKSPVPLRGYLVWATYYLAQCGIAIGFLRERLGEKK